MQLAINSVSGLHPALRRLHPAKSGLTGITFRLCRALLEQLLVLWNLFDVHIGSFSNFVAKPNRFL